MAILFVEILSRGRINGTVARSSRFRSDTAPAASPASSSSESSRTPSKFKAHGGGLCHLGRGRKVSVAVVCKMALYVHRAWRSVGIRGGIIYLRRGLEVASQGMLQDRKRYVFFGVLCCNFITMAFWNYILGTSRRIRVVKVFFLRVNRRRMWTRSLLAKYHFLAITGICWPISKDGIVVLTEQRLLVYGHHFSWVLTSPSPMTARACCTVAITVRSTTCL
eukprot:CAMPEP_0206292590 /NCGR_PEP_ID=MMETSP0106_2-20121207/3706_1 /ASSEMBLY_ACC=CAM_ASM_000206 /TAXON_ID=81532 /ORGANISM="Acanthoeca-like sp., Strain 10tr" /LENGTH=220 /DNA_ID=CAMNT_0053723171 /DNA_START=286 /DNA_END=948 /DNA_ORIENTATION=+